MSKIARSSVPQPPLPCRDHRACSVALLSFPSQLAYGQGFAGRSQNHRHPPDDPDMGGEVRAAFCQKIKRRSASRFGGKWHLDEMVVTTAGRKHWLWRAVDQEGRVLDVPVQSRRNARAAKQLMRKLLKEQCHTPRVMITDKLGSYAVAGREIMPDVEHRRHMTSNNRAENFHQPMRRREHIMKRFKSPGQIQRFASIHDPIANLFHFPRHALSSPDHRELRAAAMETWREISRGSEA